MGVCAHAHTRAHTHMHTRARPRRTMSRCRSAIAPLRDNSEQHISARALQTDPWARRVLNCGHVCKKVRKCLAVSRRWCTFAGMKDPEFVITGVNVLTGEREELSGAMPVEMAQARLTRELESRRRLRYQTHKRLRVERRLPVQLTFKFDEQ